MATIQLIIGSMFSGKSTELLRRCKTYLAINKNVQIINHSNDTRCDDVVQTHDKTYLKAKKVNRLDMLKIENKVDVVAIDEAQFFPDLIDFIVKNESRDIIILIAGLDGDSNRNKFGQILECIPYANNVTKLNAMCAVCKDGTLGCFSKRLSNENEQICVGAEEKYVAVCRKCYLNKND